MGIKFTRPTYYIFDPKTKEFMGTTEGDIDHNALTKNEIDFLRPAFVTEVAPPDIPRGSAATWNGTSWDIVPDHRRESWWDAKGEPAYIEDLGDPTALGYVRDRPEPPAPPPPDPVEIRRNQLMADLQHVTLIGSSFVALKQDVPTDILAQQKDIVDELQKLDPKAKVKA